MFGDFFLIEREGTQPMRGERLAFGDTNGRNEAWLRDTLFANPELLPINSIDPAYGPLIPLCTELRTEAGPLDIAFINSFGRLTLVECKLWRNPQSRREVVAQVLDYARAISRWSYSDLQRQVAMARRRTGNVPYELVQGAGAEVLEHDFVDATASALRAGRFLLLIAGDGIREDVGALSELINNNSALGFSFGLVEVALYGLPDGALAIQPRAVAKTRIIERNVVVLADERGAPVAAGADPFPTPQQTAELTPSPLGEGQRQAEFRAWYAPIISRPFDDPDQDPPKLFWPNNIRAFLPWPRVWILATSSGTRKTCGVWMVEGGTQKTLMPHLSALRTDILAELPQATEARTNAVDGTYFSTLRAWDTFADEDAKRDWMWETINAYVNVFRPLLKRLAAQTTERL